MVTQVVKPKKLTKVQRQQAFDKQSAYVYQSQMKVVQDLAASFEEESDEHYQGDSGYAGAQGGGDNGDGQEGLLLDYNNEESDVYSDVQAAGGYDDVNGEEAVGYNGDPIVGGDSGGHGDALDNANYDICTLNELEDDESEQDNDGTVDGFAETQFVEPQMTGAPEWG